MKTQESLSHLGLVQHWDVTNGQDLASTCLALCAVMRINYYLQ